MLFSVIIPIYKVEKYLRSCLDSVLNQGFADYQVIMVDDGSPDGCPAIVDEYAARDGRFVAIHKQNGGLVSARKTGIEAAAGDYVVYLDSDDRLADNALQQAADIISEKRPDLMSFSLCFAKEDGSESRIENSILESGLYDGDAMAQHIIPKILLSDCGEHLPFFICGKILKRSVMYPAQMNVDSRISYAEDVAAIVPAYFSCKSVYISDSVSYIVTERAGSMSRKFYMGMFDELILAVKNLDAHTRGIEEQIDRYCLFECLVLLQTELLSGSKKKTRELQEKINDETLQKHIKNAQFKWASAKSKLFYRYVKKNRIGMARFVLRAANLLKKK